jgi:hypothetical protein
MIGCLDSKAMTAGNSAVVGDAFFDAKPYIKVVDLFLHLKKIKSKQADAVSAVEARESAAMRSIAEALGYLEAAKGVCRALVYL